MTNLPSKQELKDVLSYDYHQAKRDDKQRGTNCESFHLNYPKKRDNGTQENIRFYVKKAFVRGIPIDKFESDVQIIKRELGNIVPNQAFIPHKDEIFVFCSPIHIKCDILLRANYQYVLDIVKANKKLLKQLKFFVEKYQKLLDEGRVLDLHGQENLVISAQDKLYYVDSFLVFHDNPTIREHSIENLNHIKRIIFEVEKHSDSIPKDKNIKKEPLSLKK